MFAVPYQNSSAVYPAQNTEIAFINAVAHTFQKLLHNVSWAATVVSGVFSLGAAFTGSLIVTLPMLCSGYPV